MKLTEMSAIDLAFERFLREQESGEYNNAISKAGLALSVASRHGHSTLNLEEITQLENFPDRQRLEEALANSTLVSDGSAPAPLILDKDGFLSLYKYWIAEKELAAMLISRSKIFAPLEDATVIIRQFPDSSSTVNWQAIAVFAAVTNNLTFITGGPGTGKTTTAAAIVKTLLELNPTMRFALIAPTGKAAARLEQSLNSQELTLKAKTVHSFLGWRGNTFRHNANNPVTCDCVIVDEASMIDVLLMHALFSALPDNCRIIMLGDENQLASVEAGCVLSDICHHNLGFSPEFIDAVDNSGLKVEADICNSVLANNVVRLQKNWRFANQPGISALAAGIQTGKIDPELFRRFADIQSEIFTTEKVENWLEKYTAAITSCPTAQDALNKLKAIRVICALRNGPLGIDQVNNRCKAILENHTPTILGEFYNYRPIIIEQNDYQTGLFNGDTGICLQNDNDGLSVYFENGLILSPARLPRHSSAWAITVHKSQGSEFDDVLLILPESDNPLCCRELLYTGVTRSRRSIEILAPEESLQKAAGTPLKRISGLRKNLEAQQG